MVLKDITKLDSTTEGIGRKYVVTPILRTWNICCIFAAKLDIKTVVKWK